MIELRKNESLAFIDSTGAYLSSLILNGVRILKESEDGESTHGGSAILIPFANRIKDARYVFQGKEFFLPVNDGNNSIHGLVREKIFNIVKTTDDSAVLRYDLEDSGYPSKIQILVSYHLAKYSISVDFTVINTGGRDVPIVVGAHPYFLVNGEYFIHTDEPVLMLNYTDHYFPDGNARFFDIGKNNLSGMNLDNSFFGGGEITLISRDLEISIYRNKMPFFVLYNGKYSSGKSIAIEPMTAAPDAYNNGIGLNIIRPGNKFECGFGIKLRN